MMRNIKEPLDTVLRTYCHVECYDPRELRQAVLSGEGFPYDVELLKEQLGEAIKLKSITPEEYESLTDEDFDSQEDLQEWLQELFDEIF